MNARPIDPAAITLPPTEPIDITAYLSNASGLSAAVSTRVSGVPKRRR